MTKSLFTKIFKKGETVFEQGSPGNCAFLIDKGLVEIQVEEDGIATPVEVLSAGDIFGEMSIIDGSDRSAKAVALESTQLMVVSREQLSERVEESDPIVKFLIAVLLKRIRSNLYKNKPKQIKDEDKTSTNIINLRNFIKSKKEDDENAVVIDKIKLEKDLKDALEENQLKLYYQPIVEFQTGLLAGFEALIRWDSPDRGMVRPDIFMGIAEETSLIVPIGQWVAKQAIKDFRYLKEVFAKNSVKRRPLFISINIAGKQLKDPNLFPILSKVAKKEGISPKEIKLEITERILVERESALEWIKRCRKKGFSIALDDFGTGYSSLSYLAQLEVNCIKIDKSFIDKMLTDKKTLSIVEALVNLSKTLEMTVIAEGIETPQQRDLLKKIGCNYMQGYLLSRPLPRDQVINVFVKDQDKKAA